VFQKALATLPRWTIEERRRLPAGRPFSRLLEQSRPLEPGLTRPLRATRGRPVPAERLARKEGGPARLIQLLQLPQRSGVMEDSLTVKASDAGEGTNAATVRRPPFTAALMGGSGFEPPGLLPTGRVAAPLPASG